jgi:tRNA (uracil-5-)-methyltransferase TRM9
VIAKFLSDIPTGWIGLDSGTGNGKYLPLTDSRAYTIGLDRSKNLLQIAQRAGNGQILREVVCGDVLDSVWREGLFVRAFSLHLGFFIDDIYRTMQFQSQPFII